MTIEITPILSILRTTPLRWLNLIDSLPQPLLVRVPATGQWSALACLQHMIDVERVFQLRLRAFLDGQESFPAFNPDAEGSQNAASPSAQDLVKEFAGLRASSLKMIVELQPADLQRQCRHQELGRVTLEQMLNEWPAHDLNHTVQAERALMQPFIQACGPWQVYFSDHVVRSA
jgi:hypothetical protein